MPCHHEVREQILLLELEKEEHIPATSLSLEMRISSSWRGSQPVSAAWEGIFWGSVTSRGAAFWWF